MNDVQPQSLRVTAAWRRDLRVWLATHDLSISDIAEPAALALLNRDHGDTVYIPPQAGQQRVFFSIPDQLHTHITDIVLNAEPRPLWRHGIRSLRDFYLVALDQHITAHRPAIDHDTCLDRRA